MLGFALLTGLLGARRGFLATALAAVGLVVGALLGARLAPHLLSEGSTSPYTPLVALLCAGALAVLFEAVGATAGGRLRGTLQLRRLRGADSVAGFVLGAAMGLVLVWVVGAVALQLPGQTRLRQEAQRSEVLQQLNEIAPPSRALRALARVDPFPSIVGPLAPVEPPSRQVLRTPGVRTAAPSVVRVLGTACGLAVSGSGWVAAPGLVVTNAHVVAGQDDTTVEAPGSGRLDAEAVAFDATNDVVVLRVRRLTAPPLRLVEPDPGDSVAVLGYPENGPFRATAGRVGPTVTVLTEDALGRRTVARRITSFRGRVRKGNSGGPAVNARGEVETTVFASRRGSDGGFGVPTDLVRKALSGALEPVSTGGC
ncbi:MAG: MarP family serine protease [Gaiellaceae bacterium]